MLLPDRDTRGKKRKPRTICCLIPLTSDMIMFDTQSYLIHTLKQSYPRLHCLVPTVQLRVFLCFTHPCL